MSLYIPSAFSNGLDVNDVSYLIPLNEVGLSPSFSLKELNKVSEENFKRVLTFEHPHLEINKLPYTDARAMKSQNNWYLTSWRFDPCGESFHFNNDSSGDLIANEKAGCQARIRFVFQPLNIFDYPLANAVHILFALDKKQSLEVVKKLKKLQQVSIKIGAPTSRKNLGTHPGLEFEMNNGGHELSSLMLEAIRDITKNAHLEHITLSVRTLVNNWKFVGGSIIDGVWTRFTTKFSSNFYNWKKSNLLRGVEELKCDELSVCKMSPVPNQSGVTPLTVINEIFYEDQLDQQVSGYRSLLIQRKAEIIDNPIKTNFFNTNCISCHQSSNLRNTEKLLEPSLFRPDGPTPFTRSRYKTDLTNGIINFGYFGTIPRVSSRTAAESVLAAEKANKILNSVYKEKPIKDLSLYWNCLMTKHASSEKCLLYKGE